MSRELPNVAFAGAELTAEEWRFVAIRKGIGASSDALLMQAVMRSAFPNRLPMDEGDLERCETTYAFAPARLKARMTAGIVLGRRAVAERGLYCRLCDTFGHNYTDHDRCQSCLGASS